LSWGVLPDKRTGLPVTTCPVVVSCHCPEDNLFTYVQFVIYSVCSMYKVSYQSRLCKAGYAFILPFNDSLVILNGRKPDRRQF